VDLILSLISPSPRKMAAMTFGPQEESISPIGISKRVRSRRVSTIESRDKLPTLALPHAHQEVPTPVVQTQKCISGKRELSNRSLIAIRDSAVPLNGLKDLSTQVERMESSINSVTMTPVFGP